MNLWTCGNPKCGICGMKAVKIIMKATLILMKKKTKGDSNHG